MVARMFIRATFYTAGKFFLASGAGDYHICVLNSSNKVFGEKCRQHFVMKRILAV